MNTTFTNNYELGRNGELRAMISFEGTIHSFPHRLWVFMHSKNIFCDIGDLAGCKVAQVLRHTQKQGRKLLLEKLGVLHMPLQLLEPCKLLEVFEHFLKIALRNKNGSLAEKIDTFAYQRIHNNKTGDEYDKKHRNCRERSRQILPVVSYSEK